MFVCCVCLFMDYFCLFVCCVSILGVVLFVVSSVLNFCCCCVFMRLS